MAGLSTSPVRSYIPQSTSKHLIGQSELNYVACDLNLSGVVLGGVMVIMLAIGPRDHRFKRS
jgi:hypothetical protein